MEHTRSYFQVRPLLWAVLLLGATLAGCEKPDSDLGLDLVSARDTLGVKVIDTLTLFTATALEPAVRTNALSRNVLGSYLDRQFGVVKAGIVTQVRLSTNNVGQGQDNSGLVADSIVLALAYDRSRFGYGNLAPQVFRVFELQESLRVDSTYRNDRIPSVDVIDLVNTVRGEFILRPFDSVSVGDSREVAQLRIPLSLDLGQRLLNAWGTSDVSDNTAFLDFFKGLYVVPANDDLQPFQQGVVHLNLLSSTSRLTLYYRNTLPGQEDTLAFDFLINENCVRYTTCEHDHSAALEPGLPDALADSVNANDLTYVQSLGGLRTRVYFPALMDIVADGGLAVARAQLVVPVPDGNFPFLPPPEQLFVFRVDDNGNDVVLPDQLEGLGVIGGIFNEDDREYRFNISRYIQGVLNGTYPNNGLTIVPGSNGVTVDRAILSGGGHPDRPMKLELTFTTY